MNLQIKAVYLVKKFFITIPVFSFLFISTISIAQPRKLALIVAVGDYPKTSGWEKLSSANDAGIITEALLRQGFSKENITVLKDKQAAKAGIMAAFDKLQIKAVNGDIIYFHFSGHGQQISDDNSDEIDGLDEALIPYDAGIDYKICNAKGDNHLRDDLLGKLLDKLRSRVGVNGDVIVVIDACHSGTATRGIGRSRGTDRIFTIPQQNSVLDNSFNPAGGYYEVADDSNLAPIVIISASGAGELNREHNGYGSLSYTMSYILPAINRSNTYRELFEQVKLKMNMIVPQQNPQIEGNYNRQIFAGQAVEYQKYITVKRWLGENRLLLDAGLLNGLNLNSRVSIFPPGTTRPKATRPISTGVIKEARFSGSVVELNGPLTSDIAMKSWVFVDEFSYSSFVLRVKVSNDLPVAIKQEINNNLKEKSFIRFDNTHPQLLIETGKNNRNIIRIVSNFEITLHEISLQNHNLTQINNQIMQTIQRHVQAEMLRQIENTDNNLNLTFEMIPVKTDDKGNVIAKIELEDKKTSAGRITFTEGDYFTLRITNKGTRTAYYSLLDIQPDNVINVLIPESTANGTMLRWPADCKLDKGETEELKAVFRITRPYGTEVFKLVAADKPLNLVPVLTSRGEIGQTDHLNPFELLFAESFDLLTRSGTNLRLPPESINIQSFVFEIEAKK